MSEDIFCPFCKEGDFDLIGLKNHLLSGHCKIFDETISIEQEKIYREKAKREAVGEKKCKE